MWQAALETWNDSQTCYLFFPEAVVKKSSTTIQNDLLRHKLAIKKNKHTQIWIIISHTLNTYFDNDPRKILEAGNFDVKQILNLIQVQRREWFPYLRGPKMANYWLYILSKYTDAKFTNMDSISIIPDTHVIKSSFRLGVVKEKASPEVVAQAWGELLEGSGIKPVQMHSVLWNWSRNHFLPEV